jgi:hypothetical protein
VALRRQRQMCIRDRTNIAVLFGEDDDYFETLDKWFNNSL